MKSQAPITAPSWTGCTTIQSWINRFEAHFAASIRCYRPRPNDKWHLGEIVIATNGVHHWLRRAVDENGSVLDVLAQQHWNVKVARRFLKKLIASVLKLS